jgi:hypothetical protein
MKKIFFLCIMASSMFIFFNSCEKAIIDQGSTKVPYDPNAIIQHVHFSTDILPIFASKCIGCHNSQIPVLEPGVAYANLLNGFVTPGSPTTSTLYLHLTDVNSTHVGRSSAADQENIFNWISQGALNN